METNDLSIDNDTKVIYQGSISRKLRSKAKRPISASNRLQSSKPKSQRRTVISRRNRPRSAVERRVVSNVASSRRRPLSALPNKMGGQLATARSVITPADISRQNISQLIASVNAIKDDVVAWESEDNKPSSKSENEKQRKRPPLPRRPKRKLTKQKVIQEKWVDDTRIVRAKGDGRIMKTRRPRKQTRVKLPMSEKNIVKFMKHILEYRRQEARALAAREKSVYKIKMLSRRCSSVAADNRQNNSGPWGGGVEMVSKLEEAMAQGEIVGLSTENIVYANAVKLVKELKLENTRWDKLQALRRRRAARIIQEKLFLPRLELLYRSAVQIQRVVRGFLPRRYLNHLRFTTKRGFTVLQAIFRGVKAREHFRTMKRKKLPALLRIQRWSRVQLAKMQLRQLRREREAAITINALSRGHLTRKHTNSMRERYNAAALVIQCAFRCYKSRQVLTQKRNFTNTRATIIQCMFRSHKARRVTRLLRRLHTAVAHVADCCDQVNAVLKALRGGNMDADVITRWDEGCEAVGQAMKTVQARRIEAKAGGVDPTYLKWKLGAATETKATSLLTQHKEQEKLRIMGLSSIKTATRAFESILADRDDNYTQSVTTEQSNKGLSDGIARLDKQCNDAIRSSPELAVNTHYTHAQQLLADSKLRLTRCELLCKMAQALESAIATAKKDREWKPLLGVVEWLAHKFPELSTKPIDILPKSSAKLPTVGQSPPKFVAPIAPIEWKEVEPDLVEERLRTDVRKACLETHKLSQSFCLSEKLEETIANARDQRYEWGITQLETCLQDVLSQCPDLAGSTQVQIAQTLLQELKDEEKERKLGLQAALKKLQQIGEECRQSSDDEKLRGAIKKLLEKHPDADASKEVCEAKILVEQLARQVLQAVFDRAKIEKQPKPLHTAILRFKKNPVQEPTSMNASRHLVSESEALLHELEALHKKLASAQRQLADCLNGCYNSRVSGALQKCVDRLEKDFPDIKHGGVLAMHPAGQELKKCRENLKIFIREEEEFDKEINEAMEGDLRSINSVLEKALQHRPAYENREVVQKAIDTISNYTKSPFARAKSLSMSINNDSDYDSAFDDFDDDDSQSPVNSKSPRNIDRLQTDKGKNERKDEYEDDRDPDAKEW